jgi:hypothetical protein
MADWFFRHTEEMVASLHLLDDPALWRAAVRRVRLEAAGRPPAWLLQPTAPGPELSSPGVRLRRLGRDLAADWGEGEIVFTPGEVLDLPALVQAVPLAPQAAPAEGGACFIETPDATWFREVVKSNLMLGNDRLACLSLGEGRALTRIEGLNAFLSQRWSAEPELVRYQADPVEPRLLTPWGWGYPLADKLRLLGGGQDLWLVDREGCWRAARGPFTDVYDHLALDAAGLGLEPASPAGELPRVPVALRLEPTDGDERPQLWRLDGGGDGILERLVAEASEAELNNLQVAALSVGEPPATVLLVVERLGGPSRLPPPIAGGRAYYARLPEEQLYLPVGRRVAPLLSRRGLVEALGLAPDHLTLLDLDEAERLRLTRVPRACLGLTTDLVEYGAAQDEGAVRGLLGAVRFDFDLAGAELGQDAEGAGRPRFWERLFRRT